MTNCRSLLCERAEQTASRGSKNPPFFAPEIDREMNMKAKPGKGERSRLRKRRQSHGAPKRHQYANAMLAMKGVRLKALTLDIPFLPFRDSRVHMMKMDSLEGVFKKDKVNKLFAFFNKAFFLVARSFLHYFHFPSNRENVMSVRVSFSLVKRKKNLGLIDAKMTLDKFVESAKWILWIKQLFCVDKAPL